MKLETLSKWLLIIGGLNWGLIGLFNINLVDKLTSASSGKNDNLNKIVYILVGLAAVHLVYKALKSKKN